MGSRLKKLKALQKAGGDRLYHYTVGAYLPAIAASGEIRPAAEGVTGGERPAVWFSFHPEWEETANKSYSSPAGERQMGTRATTMTLGKGLARIKVQPPADLCDWQKHQKISGISSKMARALERSARADGANPQDWRVSYKPVPADQWLAIEINRGNGWEPWEAAQKANE